MGPTWGPPGSCRPKMGPMLAPWALLSWRNSDGYSSCQTFRADSRFVPSQWEMALLCNDVSNWLGGSLESTLNITNFNWHFTETLAYEIIGAMFNVTKCHHMWITKYLEFVRTHSCKVKYDHWDYSGRFFKFITLDGTSLTNWGTIVSPATIGPLYTCILVFNPC